MVQITSGTIVAIILNRSSLSITALAERVCSVTSIVKQREWTKVSPAHSPDKVDCYVLDRSVFTYKVSAVIMYTLLICENIQYIICDIFVSVKFRNMLS